MISRQSPHPTPTPATLLSYFINNVPCQFLFSFHKATTYIFIDIFIFTFLLMPWFLKQKEKHTHVILKCLQVLKLKYLGESNYQEGVVWENWNKVKINFNHDFTLHHNVLSLSLIAAFLKIRLGYSFWLNYHFKTRYNI